MGPVIMGRSAVILGRNDGASEKMAVIRRPIADLGRLGSWGGVCYRLFRCLQGSCRHTSTSWLVRLGWEVWVGTSGLVRLGWDVLVSHVGLLG